MSGVGLGELAVRLALRCYPRWWRERYGSDQEALVEDLRAEQSRTSGRTSGAWALAGSFVVGAVRARASGSGMPAVADLWQRRARTAIIAACLPAPLGFGAALLLLAHTTGYGTSGSGSPARVIQLGAAGQVVHWEAMLLVVLSLAFLVQLAWAATELAGELRSLTPPRRRALVTAVTLIPVVAAGMGFLLLIAAARWRPVISGSEGIGNRVIHVFYSYPGHPLAATIAFGAGCTGILGGWFGGTALLAAMAARRRFPVRALVTGVKRARAVTLVQGGVALCGLTLVATLPLQSPIGRNGGMIYRSDLGAWAPVLCAALVAAAVTTWAATRAAGQAVTRASSLGA